MSERHLYTEDQLIGSLRQGDADAFEEIFKRHWHRLYTIAHSKLQSHEDAEEIIQNIFSTLWEKRESLLIINLQYYLQTAVRNRIIDHIRLSITKKKYWEYYKNFIPQQKEITEETVVFDDLSDAMEEAVNRLPEKSRQVFRMIRLEGRSKTEIANQLHLSEKAIEYHLTKSLKELRIHLKDFILAATLMLVL